MWILIVAFTLTAGHAIAPIGSFPTESACAEYLIQLNTEDVLQELPAFAKDVKFKCVKHPESYGKDQSL